MRPIPEKFKRYIQKGMEEALREIKKPGHTDEINAIHLETLIHFEILERLERATRNNSYWKGFRYQ